MKCKCGNRLNHAGTWYGIYECGDCRHKNYLRERLPILFKQLDDNPCVGANLAGRGLFASGVSWGIVTPLEKKKYCNQIYNGQQLKAKTQKTRASAV